MKNFLLSNFLWLTFPFSPYCYSTEIIRYEDQADIAIKMIDLTKAQETGIWSWSGTLDIVQKHYVDKSENKLLMEKIFAINFVFDYRNNFSKVVLVPSEFYVFENGEKRPQPLQNESLLCKENVYYRYLAYQRTSKEQKNDDKILNTLTISYTHPKDLPSSFEPLRMSSWPNGIEDIYTIFEIYGLSDEDLRQLLMTKDKMSKEQADQFVTKLKGEGHPYMKMSQKDNLVTITRTLNGMTYVFDLSKGARPISCSNIAGNRSSWKCEFQSVSGFWIPKTTNEILIFPNGESKETVMIWNGQKINKSVSDSEFTLQKLGIRQGDLAYDSRTDTSFVIEGDEYLLPEGMEPSVNNFQFFRITCMSLGILLCILGGVGTVRKYLKKSA